jgi:hypothetical protein
MSVKQFRKMAQEGEPDPNLSWEELEKQVRL